MYPQRKWRSEKWTHIRDMLFLFHTSTGLITMLRQTFWGHYHPLVCNLSDVFPEFWCTLESWKPNRWKTFLLINKPSQSWRTHIWMNYSVFAVFLLLGGKGTLIMLSNRGFRTYKIEKHKISSFGTFFPGFLFEIRLIDFDRMLRHHELFS